MSLRTVDDWCNSMGFPAKDCRVQRLAPLCVNEKAACRMLGNISGTSLWRLRKKGLIVTVPGTGRALYPVSSLQDFVLGRTGAVTAVLSPLPRTVNRKPAP